MKRILSRSLALVLALCLCLIIGVASAVGYGDELNPNEKTYTQIFSDVPESNWAFEYIAEMVERGAVNGYPDGKFYPEKIVTREEFSKIMVVAAGMIVTPAQWSSYTDVPLDYWASPFIETARPYMTAYQDSTGMAFRPKSGALREDIAVAVVKLKGYDTRLADLSLLDAMFSDVSAISESAKPYVALAVENEIISGYTDGTFRGQNTITRSEAAAILWRAFQYGSDQKVIPGDTTQPSPAPSAQPTPKPTATPTPTPTPTPKPTPTPRPTSTPMPTPSPEPEKPYIADTVTQANITDTEMMVTMDDDSNLIYYDADEDAILSLDPDSGGVEILFDVGSATYDVATEAQGETPAGTVTYMDLMVNQVFWDDINKQLLVTGEFQAIQSTDDGWELSNNSNKKYRAAFYLRNQELMYAGEIGHDGYRIPTIMRILNDGSVATNSGIYNFTPWENITSWNTPVMSQMKIVIQNNRDIYGVYKNYNDYFIVYEYDYGTAQWAQIDALPKSDAVDYRNSVFYTWTSNEIRATRPTDMLFQTKLDPSADVDVLDLRPLPTSPDNIFVTADEQYLFYDSSAGAIRMISANPDY